MSKCYNVIFYENISSSPKNNGEIEKISTKIHKTQPFSSTERSFQDYRFLENVRFIFLSNHSKVTLIYHS
jgi:hypothetical protein